MSKADIGVGITEREAGLGGGHAIERQELVRFEDFKIRMIGLAREQLEIARQNKTQYRDFYVGCAMLDSNGNMFVGHNTKKKKTDAKYCAERSALEGAVASGSIEGNIVAIVVISEELHTDPSVQHEETTLKPCLSCKSMLGHEPHINKDTILLTINDRDKTQRLEDRTTIGEFDLTEDL